MKMQLSVITRTLSNCYAFVVIKRAFMNCIKISYSKVHIRANTAAKKKKCDGWGSMASSSSGVQLHYVFASVSPVCNSFVMYTADVWGCV